jgi:regulatory protein
MNRAVKLLAAKPRSIGELRGRLLEEPWTNSAIVDAVIEKLQSYDYLNDEKYACELALSRLRQRPQGKRKLRQTLSRKQLERETVDAAIETAFDKMPEVEMIDAAIEKRLRLKGRPESREDVKKFYDHLLRQGFGFDLVRDRVAAIKIAAPEDPEME